MAKIGIQKILCAIMDDQEKYGDIQNIGTLVTFNGTPNKVEGEDWGDNRQVESYSVVNKIALSIELNDFAGKLYADFLGHEYDETNDVVTVKTTDNSPYAGIGAIGNSLRNGKEVFVSKVYKKVKLTEPNDENSTSGESIEYKHTTLEGNAYPDKDNVIKKEGEFDTLAAAETWLRKQLTTEPEA